MDHAPSPPPRHAIGCMSGTSLDALDVVLVRAQDRGLSMRSMSVLDGVSVPLGGWQSLSRLASGEALPASAVAAAALELGTAHAAAARSLCRRAGIDRPDLACAHGQTVWHRPPGGWQVLNPWPLARELGCPVVFDLRGADLAGGGQGAPLTPLADWVLFRDPSETRVVVNLGGFCNATVLPAGGDPGAVRGADLCACNLVLDAAARAGIGQRFDPEGGHAWRGTPDAGAAGELFALLDAQRARGRSLGSGDEAGAWVSKWCGRLAGEALLASACAGVGRAVGVGVARLAGRDADVFAAGGSVRNRALMRTIGETLGRPVRPSDEAGVPAAWREGACFAVLGLLLADGVEVSLPGVTGRAGPIPLSGAWIFPPRQADAPRPIAGT